MAQILMVYDFGSDEDAAQQARHKIEGWKQGFRLGEKLSCKFEREEAGSEAEPEDNGSEAKEKKSSAKKPAKKAAKGENANGRVRMIVRLGFSDHEKLSQQRWLDRIPTEEPFKSAKGETFRQGDPEFSKSLELYELLD